MKMEVFLPFSLAFLFSFIGSIPPGTLNLTILQLGIEKKINIAWRFAAAAALVEYPYAWLAVKFERLILSTPIILENLKLLTAVVMILMGILNLMASTRSFSLLQRFQESGFRRGIILSILNPMAMPFWIGITAYLEGQQWINLSTSLELHSYLLGVTLGALFLLMLLTYMAKRFISRFQSNSNVKKIPGYVLLALGTYAFITYLF